MVESFVCGWLLGHILCGDLLQVKLLLIDWSRRQLHLVAVVLLLLVVVIFFLLDVIVEYLVTVLSLLIVAMQLLSLRQLEQFEGLSVLLTHIIGPGEAIQIVYKMQHLFVGFIFIERNDRDAVVDLERKTVHAIVDDNYVFKVPHKTRTLIDNLAGSMRSVRLTGEYAQIFYVVALLSEEAVLAVQTMSYQLVVWINVVKYSVSVRLVTGCEHNDLEVLVGFFKTFHDVRSNIYTCINCFLVWEVNLEHNVGVLRLNVVNAMNKRLIHVKDGQFFL